MSKFRVLVTRDITESAEVIVEAEDEDAAGDLATQMALDGMVTWDYDEGSSGSQPPYITGCEEADDDS